MNGLLVKDTNWKKVQVRPYCSIYPVHDTSWFHAIKKYYRNEHWNHNRMILKFLVNEGRLRCGPLICLLCFKCTKSDCKVPCYECVSIAIWWSSFLRFVLIKVLSSAPHLWNYQVISLIGVVFLFNVKKRNKRKNWHRQSINRL